MKRLVSILLAATMVLAMANVYALAADEADESPAEVSVSEDAEPSENQKPDESLQLMAEHEIYEKDHKTEIEIGVDETLKIWFYTKGGCDGISRAMSFKSSDKSIMVIADKPKIAGSDKGASWVKIKGVKEGSAMLTASVRGALSHNGEIYCTTDVKIIVKGSGTSEPEPEPEPEPSTPSKTPTIETSESSVQMKTNEEHSVIISTNLASNEYDHISASSKNGCVSATIGKQVNDTSYYLNLKGIKAGSDVITVNLEKTKTNGEKVLATVKINVTVTAASTPTPTPGTTTIWSNESDVTLYVNQSHTVVVTESGNSSEFYCSTSNKNVVAAKWGDWVDCTQQSCYLNLTGVKAGSAVVTVSAKDEKGNVLSSAKINVTVKDSGSSNSGSSDTSKPGKTGLKVKKATKKVISLAWNKAKKADGYEVWLSIKGNPKTFKVYGTSYKINLTGGKSKMAYKVKVRAWRKVNGKTIYGKWTTKKGKLK